MWWRDIALAGALGFVVRIAHASSLSRTPWLEGPIIDSLTYHHIASALARGGEFEQAFYQPPLYPWVLSLIYRAGLEVGWGVAFVHSALGALTCALLVVVGRRAIEGTDEHRRRVGLATGIMAALSGPIVLYDLEMLAPVVVNLLIVMALALALSGPPRVSVRDGLAGLSLGVAATGWVPALLLVPALIFARKLDRRRWLVALVVCASLLPPLAVTAHHNATHGAFGTVVSWNGGLNLWLGNNPRWRDTWRARPGAQFEPEYERPGRHGAITPVEQDAFYQGEVVHDVLSHPLDALGRTLEKLYYAWHGREIRRNQDFEVLRESSPILFILQWELLLCFPFGLIAPLALIAAYRRRSERGARILFAGAVAYSLVLAAYFVATRYRLPMMLLLLPLAADTIARLVQRERPSRYEIGAFAALVIVLNVPIPFTATFRADARERHLMEADAWMAQGELDRAREIARRAISRWPDDANVNMLAATVAVRSGDCGTAVPYFERVTQLVPIASTPHIDLAQCYERLGRLDDAEQQYAQVLARSGYHARALRGAAVLYMRHGRAPLAIRLLERLRESGQADDGSNFDLGRLLIDAGRYEDAIEVLRPLSSRDAQARILIRRARAMSE